MENKSRLFSVYFETFMKMFSIKDCDTILKSPRFFLSQKEFGRHKSDEKHLCMVPLQMLKLSLLYLINPVKIYVKNKASDHIFFFFSLFTIIYLVRLKLVVIQKFTEVFFHFVEKCRSSSVRGNISMSCWDFRLFHY